MKLLIVNAVRSLLEIQTNQCHWDIIIPIDRKVNQHSYNKYSLARL